MTDTDTPLTSRPRRHGLGRGLDALFGGAAVTTHASEEGSLLEIDPTEIHPNPEQPRRHFDEEALSQLAESIRTHGLLQPLVVEPAGQGYRLIAGERRLRAARIAGLATIPAVVRPASESGRHQLELALVENLQRTDLGPLEEAAAYARLVDTFGLSHDAVAARVGKSRPAVTNTLRLLNLSPPLQEALATGRMTAGHARALLALERDEDQERVARDVVTRGLSVRDTELAVQAALQHNAPAKSPASRPVRPLPSVDDDALVRELEDALGTPVRIERRRRGGRVVVEFYNDEQLDGIVRRVCAVL